MTWLSCASAASSASIARGPISTRIFMICVPILRRRTLSSNAIRSVPTASGPMRTRASVAASCSERPGRGGAKGFAGRRPADPAQGHPRALADVFIGVLERARQRLDGRLIAQLPEGVSGVAAHGHVVAFELPEIPLQLLGPPGSPAPL